MVHKFEMPENQKITDMEICKMLATLAQVATQNDSGSIILDTPGVRLKFEIEWKGELR